MDREFLEGMILHIEDYLPLLQSYGRRLAKEMDFSKIALCEIIETIKPAQADAEIQKLISQVGEEKELKYVGVRTGQLARALLSRYVPSAIISDSEFHLNGAKTIHWMLEHGLKDYPLIGLSGGRIEDLSPEARNFFMTTSARYVRKASVGDHASVLSGIKFSIDYVKSHIDNYLIDPKKRH